MGRYNRNDLTLDGATSKADTEPTRSVLSLSDHSFEDLKNALQMKVKSEFGRRAETEFDGIWTALSAKLVDSHKNNMSRRSASGTGRPSGYSPASNYDTTKGGKSFGTKKFKAAYSTDSSEPSTISMSEDSKPAEKSKGAKSKPWGKGQSSAASGHSIVKSKPYQPFTQHSRALSEMKSFLRNSTGFTPTRISFGQGCSVDLRDTRATTAASRGDW